MLPSVCANVPKGKLALLDDFEDGDSAALPEGQREAFWGILHDTSAGSVVPDQVFVPERTGAHGSKLAAHVKASGFSIWGVSLALYTSHVNGTARCAYNASGFAGVRFVTRGTGRMRVSLAIPETEDKEYGGTCDPSQGMVCFDQHGTDVALNDDWQLHELPWELFTQRSFGTPAVLRPDAIMALQFNFETADLPVDFWADDVGFWDGTPTQPTSSGGSGGTAGGGGRGGTTGVSGGGGMAGKSTAVGGAAGEGGA